MRHRHGFARGDDARKRVSGDLDKDLTDLDMGELSRHLDQLIAG